MASTKKPAKEGGGRKSADDSMKLDRLRELVAILEGSSSLTELEYEDADIVVRLSRGSSPAPAPVVAHVSGLSSGTPLAQAASPADSHAQGSPIDSSLEVVKSPFAGTFYRAPSPNETAFTEVGQRIKPQQLLCVIEAMQRMNDIKSEVSGTVLEIVPKNGQAVQPGDPLFKIAVER